MKRSIESNFAVKSLKKFKQIKIEDSTVINLPEELSFAFPGNVSKGKKKSQAKTYALYDFTSNNFDFMNVHSFSRNDQSLSMDSFLCLKQGDLLLRDMGFFVMGVQDKLGDKGIHFIRPKKFQIKVYRENTKQEIDLQKELRKAPFFDK